ncbi:MAG: PAS domain S-box protein [Proteobacteria bacterium]|nr:PAS domain S-box protein [Pseudomonadota bacterium]
MTYKIQRSLDNKNFLFSRQWRSNVDARFLKRIMAEEKKKSPDNLTSIPGLDTALFRICVEQMDVGVGMLDTSGIVTFANNRLAAMIGYSPSDILGRPLVSFLDPAAADVVAKQLTRQRFENREPYELTWIRKDGSRIATMVSPRPILDHDGILKGSFATVFDITEHKQIEDKLSKTNDQLVREVDERKQAEYRMKRLIDRSPIPIAVRNPEGPLYYNQKIQDAYGFNADDHPDMESFLRAAYPDHDYRTKVLRTLSKVQERMERGEEVEPVESNVTCKDGTVRPVEFYVTPVDESVIVMGTDLSDRKQSEKLLIQAEKMASLGGLAAGMAHEINNPLAGIIQNSALAKRRLLGASPAGQRIAEEFNLNLDDMQSFMAKRKILEMLDHVEEMGIRAAKIVKNMLYFSRKSSRQWSEHNVTDLLDKTVELAANDYKLTKKYNFKNVSIVRDYEDNLPVILCDGIELQQVFLNILHNAVQALHECGIPEPSIHLKVIGEDDMVRIEIADNGPGMNDETRKRVFEPFFTTKAVGKGTGLGLSVSYFIVTKNHGGTMAVESSAETGSTFIIRLGYQPN